jgi:hypothetical protein
VKVIEPTPLMREAASVLGPIVDDVVVIGALAVAVALSSDHAAGTPAAELRRVVTIGPTFDVDLAVEPQAARAVVRHLTEQGLQPSTAPGERGFTWERDGLKVQLMTRPGPPRMRSAGEPRLPVQAALAIVARNQVPVAFVDGPDLRQFRCATPGALVVLKSAAFGRTRFTGAPADRDAHDVLQLLSALVRPSSLRQRPTSPSEPRYARSRNSLIATQAFGTPPPVSTWRGASPATYGRPS